MFRKLMLTMRFEILIFGEKRVAHNFQRMAFLAKDSRPAFDNWIDYYMEQTEKQFLSQGRRKGSWKHLSFRHKLFKYAHNYDPRILFMKKNLFKSVTRLKAPFQ